MMAYVADPAAPVWTAADLMCRFGPIPLHRVVSPPAPGTATVDDAVNLDDHHDRLCELIDGTLVEKTMGIYESVLAVRLAHFITSYVNEHRLGIVAGADGMMQIFPKQVRIPDASFISWERLKDSGFPELAAPRMVPDLAAEIISRGNTAEEMQRKLQEYFAAGVRLVWYFDPADRSATVYTSPTESQKLTAPAILDGGNVLPDFALSLEDFFQTPQPGPSAS